MGGLTAEIRNAQWKYIILSFFVSSRVEMFHGRFTKEKSPKNKKTSVIFLFLGNFSLGNFPWTISILVIVRKNTKNSTFRYFYKTERTRGLVRARTKFSGAFINFNEVLENLIY